MADYNPVAAGGNYAGPTQSGSFAGTGTSSSRQTTLGIPPEWGRATVVTDRAPRPVSEQARTWTADLGGTQLKTLSQLLLEFDTGPHDPQQVDALQQLLWKGGFYSGSSKTPTFTPGEKDDPTRDALINAMEEASRSRQPFGAFLDQRASARVSAGLAGLAGDGTTPLQAKQATNPLDVKALGNKAAESGLGQDLTPDQQTQFLAQFRGAQNPQLMAGVKTAEPGAAGWAEWAGTHVREFDPTRFDARKVLNGVDVLRQVLAGRQVTNATGNAQ